MTAPLFPECEKFLDHRKKICRGERPDVTLSGVNQYRSHWGMPPLEQTESFRRMASGDFSGLTPDEELLYKNLIDAVSKKAQNPKIVRLADIDPG